MWLYVYIKYKYVYLHYTYMAYIKMQDVIDELALHGKRVFNINDVTRIIGKPKNYVSKLLASNKRIGRIERGKYYIKNGAPDLYEIASQITFPSYVSAFAAFQFYSITEQSVIRYTVFTIKRHKPVKVLNSTIEFITIAKGRFFGYKKIGNIYIATVEKAIIDSLYIRSPPLSYIEEAFSEAMRMGLIDKKMLMDFARKMSSKTIMLRVLKLLKTNQKVGAKLGEVVR